MLRTLASLWSWLAIALVAATGFFLQLALAVVTLPFDRRRHLCGRFFRWEAMVCTALIPSWRFRVAGPAPSRIAGRTVVVSNHASHADPFLISRLPWEMKWLAKASLFKVPFVGWSMWLAGDVPVRRGERASGEGALAACARWLERGMPVMIFPEGTRSRDGQLQPFKDGAFRLAIETAAAILPIAVDGTHDALPKHSWKFGDAHARVMVGEPIATAGLSLDDVPALKEEARRQIESLLARLRSMRP